MDKFGIYTIRGPRQIGKTTFIKLFIRKLIEDDINTLRILFFTCDMIKDNSELVDIIKIYLQSFNISKNERTYIFIDEITMVNNWQSAIKYLVDIGLIVNAVVILTGSSAYDLKVSSERMPGRRGEGKDLLFLPLTFNEYLKAIGIEIDPLNIRQILLLGEEDLKRLNFKYSFLQEYFLKYINSGGFPKVINEYMNEDKITEQTKNIYRNFILGDAEKYMNSRGTIIEIFKKLPEIIGQRFSWRSILNDLGKSIKSVDTIQKYFEYLAYSFIISTVYFIDPSTKTIKFKKALNQTHPFLYGNLNSRDS
ncbi:MAG: ATP-binding protein [Defluviitoga tunisiensis]